MAPLFTFWWWLRHNDTDGCLGGGDYAAIILDIEGLLLAACGAIRGYNIDLIGLLTGKLLVIAKIWAAIVIVCVHPPTTFVQLANNYD
jgi:hypothetical protein